MTESEKKSHWQFLANLLGAKPKEQEELKAETLAPANEPDQTLPAPFKPIEKKKPDTTDSRPALNKKKHWGDVAKSLGIDAPALPEPEEPAVEPKVDPIVEAKVTFERTAPPPVRDEPRRSHQPPPSRIYERIVEHVADDDTDEEVEKVDRPVSDGDGDGDDRDRPRRSRRRGGRRRRRKSPSEEPRGADESMDVDDERSEETTALTPIDDAEIFFERDEVEDADDGEAKPARRRRRRGRGRQERDETPAPRPARRPVREIEPEVSRVRDDRRDPIEDVDEDDDEVVDKGVSRRAVPSWQDAIDHIVTNNLANRQRSRERDRGGSDRGRGRGGGRGGRPGDDRGRR